MTRTSLATGVILSISAVLGAGIAEAQTASPQKTKVRRGETVTTRPRPEVDPLGVRVGSFLLFPKLTLEQSYNDNIFATNDDEDDDFITNIRPEVSLESDWTNHALRLSGGFDKAFYFDHDDEDYFDWFTDATGRLDVTRDINVEGGAAFRHGHDERSDPDDSGGKKPDEYDQIVSFLRYNQRFGRFRGTVDGNFNRYDYEDTPGNINNDDRDRNVFEGGVRLGYEIQPQYEAFVRVSGNRRLYDQTPDDDDRTRDSTGYQVVGGVALDLTGVLFGDIYVGYLDQRFDDSAEEDVSGLTFGTSLNWNVTPLTTISAKVTQTVQETTDVDASAYLLTVGSLAVDHELLRNLLLNANVSVGQEEYEGDNREDMIYTAGVGARYLMNRYFYASLAYRFASRDGDTSDDDYDQNVIRLGLEGQF